jgi:hypothetical protein
MALKEKSVKFFDVAAELPIGSQVLTVISDYAGHCKDETLGICESQYNIKQQAIYF